MAWLAAAFAVGPALHAAGFPLSWAAVLALLPAVPIGAFARPTVRWGWVVAVLAGLALSSGGPDPPRCPFEDGSVVTLRGRVIEAPTPGPALLRLGRGAAATCGRHVRAVGLEGFTAPLGGLVEVIGRWRPDGAGRPRVVVRSVQRVPDPHPWAAGPIRWRRTLRARIERLFGPRGPLVAALLLAERQGLNRGVRERFARVGLAHLLAISGFHVGVIAGTLLMLGQSLGMERRRASAWATVVVWAYVGFLGLPSAATRAALILTCAVAGRLRGRPVARGAPLAVAFLVLVAADPRVVAGVGFQLSFAGAAGLTLWSRRIDAQIRTRVARVTPGRAARWVTAVSGGSAAGVAATLATLPFVAWHFGRVSLVGVPATLVVGPLVALALPGAIASMALSFVWMPAGTFLAGGVTALLNGVVGISSILSALPFAAMYVGRPTVALGTTALLVGLYLAPRGRGVRTGVRWTIVAGYGVACALAWGPVGHVLDRVAVHVVAVDVGQGDAILVRSPRGRWLLVDAGPAGWTGTAPVLRELRRRGVTELAGLVLTHPDFDHIGGAEEVVSDLDVGFVMDPARPAGKEGYVSVLEVASRRGIPWKRALAGQAWDFDGVRVRVLAPFAAAAPGEGSNALSVVLRIDYRGFSALLTGDAPVEVERAILPELQDGIDVLKVGHHGSATSSDSLFLSVASPVAALVSVGRGNRYGHPDPRVIRRLQRAGARIWRTDRDGTLDVRVSRNGHWWIRPGRRRR